MAAGTAACRAVHSTTLAGVIGIGLLTLVPGEVGGSETYARALTRGLAEHGRLEYRALCPPVAPGAGEGLPSVVVEEYRRARTPPERLAAMTLAVLRPGPLRRRFAGLEAVHFPLTIALPPLDLPTAVTVHDLQHLELPFVSRAERAFRALAYHRSARRARIVIVPSGAVRDSVVRGLGIPVERIRVIHHGIDHERFRPASVPREPYLLYPARPWPHKNHARLFEAFVLLRRERPELRLVLTGGGHEGRPVPAGVEVRGLVGADELVSLLQRAAALVFPSLSEGFGQPPLEAMACGCPVAVSGLASLREICGEAAAYFDPYSPEAIAESVIRVLEQPDELARRGLQRAAAFNWRASALAHEAAFLELRSGSA